MVTHECRLIGRESISVRSSIQGCCNCRNNYFVRFSRLETLDKIVRCSTVSHWSTFSQSTRLGYDRWRRQRPSACCVFRASQEKDGKTISIELFCLFTACSSLAASDHCSEEGSEKRVGSGGGPMPSDERERAGESLCQVMGRRHPHPHRSVRKGWWKSMVNASKYPSNVRTANPRAAEPRTETIRIRSILMLSTIGSRLHLAASLAFSPSIRLVQSRKISTNKRSAPWSIPFSKASMAPSLPTGRRERARRSPWRVFGHNQTCAASFHRHSHTSSMLSTRHLPDSSLSELPI